MLKQKVGRRKFLGLMAAAPAAVKQTAGELAGLSSSSIGVTASNAFNSPIPVSSGSSEDAKLAQLARAGLLPDWLKQQWVEEDRRSASYMMDPSIACLRSVSLAAKLEIQGARSNRRRWQTLEERGALSGIRQTFWSKLWGSDNRVHSIHSR